MKLWQSALFLFGLIALLMALNMSGLTRGLSDWGVAAAILVIIGGFIVVMGKRKRK